MHSRTTTALIALFVVLFAPAAIAKPEYLEVFQAHFKGASGPVSERSCANCHISTSDFGLNLLGKQIAHEKVAVNSRTVTDALLAKIETLDANGDGVSNADELKAGKNPAAPVAGAKPVQTAPEPAREKSLVPKNAFHPAIVHLPIGLFIGGLILDALGYRKKNSALLLAGWFNLVFAAVTTFGALVSGYVASLFMKVPLNGGVIQQHMFFALITTGLIWTMIAMRARRHEKMGAGLRIAYFAIALVSVALISWCGHLGGVFVYGE